MGLGLGLGLGMGLGWGGVHNLHKCRGQLAQTDRQTDKRTDRCDGIMDQLHQLTTYVQTIHC
jgi:hypothetical protein